MTTSEQYAVDLVKVLAQRPDALNVARLVLKELADLKGRAQCVVCGRDFKRSMPHQRYCRKNCRWRRQYLLQCAELGSNR